MKIIFLDPKKSLERLEPLILSLIQGKSSASAILKPSYDALLILLIAHYKVVEELNNDVFRCRVPWNKETGLPSCPTLIADAESFIKLFNANEEVTKIIHSFLGWSLFAKEQKECVNFKNLNLHSVNLSIMTHYTMEEKSDKIFFEQLVGIKTNNTSHLHYYYDSASPSKAIKKLIIVSRTVAIISTGNNQLSLSLFQKQKTANQFNQEEFAEQIEKIANTQRLAIKQ